MTDNTSSEWLFPYGSDQRYHLHHSHLFASDIEATIAFYEAWFDAKVVWDGGVRGARNVFMKIGIGAMHLYDQPPRDIGKNAIHHLGMQVVGLAELYERMMAAGLNIPNPIGILGAGVATSCSKHRTTYYSKSLNQDYRNMNWSELIMVLKGTTEPRMMFQLRE